MPTYIITGANRGLGLEFVRQLSADSSNTIIAAHRSSSSDLSEVKSATSSSPAKIHFMTCDTSSLDSISSFAKAVATLGLKIDFLVNNAGANSVPHETSLSISPEGFDHDLRTNILGPAKTTQFLVEAGALSRDVRILNMSSGLGSLTQSLGIEPRKCATYSISKSGVNALTVQQSGDVRTKLGGAVVISMDPGWVKTRMGGEGAVLEPEDSIGGMIKVLHGLKDGDNGKFFCYSGEQVPW